MALYLCCSGGTACSGVSPAPGPRGSASPPSSSDWRWGLLERTSVIELMSDDRVSLVSPATVTETPIRCDAAERFVRQLWKHIQLLRRNKTGHLNQPERRSSSRVFIKIKRHRVEANKRFGRSAAFYYLVFVGTDEGSHMGTPAVFEQHYRVY